MKTQNLEYIKMLSLNDKKTLTQKRPLDLLFSNFFNNVIPIKFYIFTF